MWGCCYSTRYNRSTHHEKTTNLYGPVTGTPLVKNWPYATTVAAGAGYSPVYMPLTRLWYSFRANGADTTAYTSPDGNTWTVRIAGTDLNGFNPGLGAACVPNDSTNDIFLGGDPTGSSNQKLRHTSDGGDNWSPIVCGGADANYVTAMTHTYVGSFAFLVGMNDTSIWRSATGLGGAGYIEVLAGSSVGEITQFVLGHNGTTNVMLAIAEGSGVNYWSSLDGTTWTLRTMAGIGPRRVTYSWYWKKFVAIVEENIVTSSDGVTWSSSVHDFGFEPDEIVAVGSYLLLMADPASGTGIYISEDCGDTWYFTWDSAVAAGLNSRFALAEQRKRTSADDANTPIDVTQILATHHTLGTHLASLRG